MKSVEKNSTPVSFIMFDKWMMVRSLQISILSASIVVGVAHLLKVNALIYLFQLFPEIVNLPLISNWATRVSHTYYELEGLEQVLQFVWLLVLFMALANLVVALPELRCKPLAKSPLEDERAVVDRALHSKLYHRWICLHFDAQAFTGSKDTATNQQAPVLHQTEKSLAKLIVSNLHKLPASGYLCMAALLVFYFSGSEAGAMDFVRRFVYLGYPLMIFYAGLLITEIMIYFCAVFLSFIDNN